MEDTRMRELLERSKVVAVVGASPRPERDSHEVMAALQSRGYRTLPVNPVCPETEILGEPVYRALADIRERIDIVDVFRRSEHVSTLVDEAISVAAGSIWLQLGVRDDAALARAEAKGLETVSDRCIKVELARLLGPATGSGA